MSRWTEKDLSVFEKNSGRGKAVVAPGLGKSKLVPKRVPVKRSKYHAEHTVIDGIRFGSKLEARRYQELLLLMRAGKCWFIRQPIFDLGGGTTCRPDYLIVWTDALIDGVKVTIEDITGVVTKSKVRNYKQLKAKYGVDVQIVRSGAK